MRTLSKSKLLAHRQCPKRLWLEVHHPELREDSSATQASFAIGHGVGAIAQQIYDPWGHGALIDPWTDGFEVAFSQTEKLLQSNQPIFEAGFRANGALAFADVMLPVQEGRQRYWRMVEVKSSTSVKDYHRDDAAIQAFIARSCGVRLTSIALAHIDTSWVYPGADDYSGLLIESDLTEEAFSRGDEVREWIASAQAVVARKTEPKISTGSQCSSPYACGFHGYCQRQEPQAVHPIEWLPGRRSHALQAHIDANGLLEMQDAPDALLNARQQRVKAATLDGKAYFDQPGARNALAAHKLPAYFLDFETIQFAVPIWKGTRPYQQVPFQFSVHRLSSTGNLDQIGFLDVSGSDPSRSFAEKLLSACGERGPIFVYNAGFESARISELAQRFPKNAKPLWALNERIVDLLPIARDHFYDPSQQGSWSIKAVLPALCPELNYADLDSVQDGGMAMQAFQEAIAKETSSQRKEEIERQLLAYCSLDTYAMVRLWAAFSGSSLRV